MNKPDWYWCRGLHDAKIVSAQTKESKWNTDDKRLILKIDCDGALYEKNITEIEFCGFKILTDDFDIDSLNGGWWLSDVLKENGKTYYLELQFETAKNKKKRLKLSFQSAKVL